MSYIRCRFAFLMATTLLLPPLANAKTWPLAQEEFIQDLQHPRIVRMEIVQLTTLTLDFTQRDSFLFDGSVVSQVYAKQPEANCSVKLDAARRAEILSEFNKYPANFTQKSDQYRLANSHA